MKDRQVEYFFYKSLTNRWWRRLCVVAVCGGVVERRMGSGCPTEVTPVAGAFIVTEVSARCMRL